MVVDRERRSGAEPHDCSLGSLRVSTRTVRWPPDKEMMPRPRRESGEFRRRRPCFRAGVQENDKSVDTVENAGFHRAWPVDNLSARVVGTYLL